MSPHSRVLLLDDLLTSFRPQAHLPAPGGWEKLIPQIPPNNAEGPTQGAGMGPTERASYLAIHQNQRVELRGFEPLTPSMRTRCATGLRHSPKTGSQRSKHLRSRGRPTRPRRGTMRTQSIPGVPSRQSPTARTAASAYWS